MAPTTRCGGLPSFHFRSHATLPAENRRSCLLVMCARVGPCRSAVKQTSIFGYSPLAPGRTWSSLFKHVFGGSHALTGTLRFSGGFAADICLVTLVSSKCSVAFWRCTGCNRFKTGVSKCTDCFVVLPGEFSVRAAVSSPFYTGGTVTSPA